MKKNTKTPKKIKKTAHRLLSVNNIWLKNLIFLIIALTITSSYSQSQMTAKEVFFYNLKINKLKATDVAEQNPYKVYQWFHYYVEMFDKQNYDKYKNDEFKWGAYSKKIINEINTGIQSVEFNKLFYCTGEINLDKYNSEYNYFPVGNGRGLNDRTIAYIPRGNNFNFDVSFNWNIDDFKFILKMDPLKAEKFIELRKSANGKINRTINAKIFYSVVNKSMLNFRKTNSVYIGTYIHKIIFYDGTIILGEIRPSIDYYDKVNLVKYKDDSEKIFFDKNWKVIDKNNSSAAAYYRIINYKNGKIDNPIIDYYLSGAKQMVGNFSEYDKDREGIYTWYYENGQKKEEVTYLKGIKNGQYASWYENGQKKQEVSYIDGKKEGCDYNWNEDGTCIGWNGNWSYLSSYFYTNGEGGMTGDNKRCPCINNNNSQVENTGGDVNAPSVEKEQAKQNSISTVRAVELANQHKLTTANLMGNWESVWTQPGWKMKNVMELKLVENEIIGKLIWQAVEWPENYNYYYKNRAGNTGIEHVRGFYDFEKNILFLKGYNKDDPYGIIGLDEYKFSIIDQNHLSGITKTNENNWTGKIVAKR